ncbi:pisatin demethylase [Coccidioides immitis H538.4]|uniref:Pisatin demethylase n=1 Tax=Coccidioides immitis H538.4 TaxID=396776 RepID=A0A0J8RV05_COCIT|nr:pisatin demethylase [Coccidioides immitis H538.4]
MAEGFIYAVSNSRREDVLSNALVIGIALILAITFWVHSRDPLRSIPGPLWAKWTPFWLVHYARSGNMHRQMIATHKKYGRLVRVGPNEVSTANPEALKAIYGAGGDFRKSDWYSVWQGLRKWDLFGERNESIHRAQRRLVSQIYSLSNMKKLEPYVDKAVVLFMTKMSEMQGQQVNMSKWAQLFAFDVIGEVTFSKRFGFMDAGKDDGAFSLIDKSLRCAAWVGYVPWVYWTNLRLSPIIAMRSQKEARHQDILGQLFDVSGKSQSWMTSASHRWLLAISLQGAIQRPFAISSLLYHVVKNEQCKKRLVEEIDATARANNIGHGDIFSLETANNMPYLQACMWEALRCHPAVGMNLGRVVPPQGVKIDGQYLPGGTVVGANAWVIHQDKDTFGEDAHKFRPERWIEEPDRVSQMRRVFFTFGGGSRFCIGKNIGWLEMSKFVPTLFHDFEIALADADQKLKELAWSFVKVENLYMILKPRKNTSNGRV